MKFKYEIYTVTHIYYVRFSIDAKGKPGNPGKLSIEVFNLMKNTVQKFDLPGSDGSTTFVIG
uniref:Uncharacterized protein n=1 Tax=Romanomermis culicivorax TaxID=13658 RepID=A0A915HSV5_ROMCU